VSNLVGNAVQHGHPNAPVKVRTAGDDPDSVTLVVENQGPAIPGYRRLNICDPLNRPPKAVLRAHGGSLGLGLYIAREIAFAHGGSVKLVSSNESRTLFEVRLPRVSPAT
jgi:signal transduction histidine kinase